MKKSIIILTIILSSNLYSFFDDFEDIVKDSFENLFQIIGIITMVIVVMFFVKKFINKEYEHKKYDNTKKIAPKYEYQLNKKEKK